MSVNLLVWKWSPQFDSAAKRRKHGLKYVDVTGEFVKTESHPAMSDWGFEDFDQAVVEALGPPQADGPYIVERHACARVFNLPTSRAPELVPKLGKLAQRHGLTSAEL